MGHRYDRPRVPHAGREARRRESASAVHSMIRPQVGCDKVAVALRGLVRASDTARRCGSTPHGRSRHRSRPPRRRRSRRRARSGADRGAVPDRHRMIVPATRPAGSLDHGGLHRTCQPPSARPSTCKPPPVKPPIPGLPPQAVRPYRGRDQHRGPPRSNRSGRGRQVKIIRRRPVHRRDRRDRAVRRRGHPDRPNPHRERPQPPGADHRPRAGGSSTPGPVEGAAQVGDQVVGRFDPDRQADERVLDLEDRPRDRRCGSSGPSISISDSTPPSDSARVKIRVASQTATARAWASRPC